ncbi:Dabb family protein [bacterium]|nr:Dabb family protein [bacterium]
MIRHVVCIRFRKDVPADATDALVEALRALPPKIPEIRSYQVGQDVVQGPNSADVVLIADFDDLDSLGRYRVHPDHEQVVGEYIRPYLEAITAADFEVD